MKYIKTLLVFLIIALTAACGRIETGHSGVRTSWNKVVSPEEVKPGFYVAVTDSVTEYVTNEITMKVENERPQALGGSYLKDLDYQYIYSVEPTQLADIAVKYKNRHLYHGDDIYPMGLYVDAVVRSAMRTAIGEVDPLEANNKRDLIQRRTIEIASKSLASESLDGKIKVHQVIINNVEIDPRLQESILRNQTAKKDNETKDIEIDTARKENLRMQQLASNANSEAYIKLLNAQANMKIADGIAAGKVNTIVVPQDFKGIVNVK